MLMFKQMGANRPRIGKHPNAHPDSKKQPRALSVP